MSANLQTRGFRFIHRAGAYEWRHPAEIQSTDTDCTDMTDEEFEAYVLAHQPA